MSGTRTGKKGRVNLSVAVKMGGVFWGKRRSQVRRGVGLSALLGRTGFKTVNPGAKQRRGGLRNSLLEAISAHPGDGESGAQDRGFCRFDSVA